MTAALLMFIVIGVIAVALTIDVAVAIAWYAP
jgi:hypothetical protein